MALKNKIQSFINELNAEAMMKKHREKYMDLDDENSVVIGTSDFGDIAFDKRKLRTNTRCLIIGTAGSGKSYLTRNIIETVYNTNFNDEDSKNSREKIIMIHDPEGEYFNLRSHPNFNFVIFGKGKDCDIEIDKDNAADFALKCMEHKINCIIDYQGIAEEQEKLEIAIAWNSTLIDAPKEFRIYLFLFIDEAHRFAKKADTSPLNVRSKICLKHIAQLGRKRGIHPFFITQRVTHLHNDITAECNNFLIGKSMIDTDIRRNGELTGLLKPKQQQIFKTLQNEFIIKGESFRHTVDDLLSGELIKCKSNGPITKHGKENFDIDDPLYYEPSTQVKQWIQILKGGKFIEEEKREELKKEKIENWNKDDIQIRSGTKIKTQAEKILTKEMNTSDSLRKLAENIFETWFHIICFFDSIRIEHLYLLSVRDDYNHISSEMELKLFFKMYKGLFIQQEDTIWFNPKNPNDQSQKSSLEISKSDHYINMWRFKINNIDFEKILTYLYKDENCNNSYKEISDATGVDIPKIKEFVNKYEKCHLVKEIESDVFINTIFFHPKIHTSEMFVNEEDEDDLQNEDQNEFEEDDINQRDDEDFDND